MENKETNKDTEYLDIDASGFECVEYENDDVDTDRGVWRQRGFSLVFKSHVISLSEEDFSALTEAMKQYVDNARAWEQHDKEMREDYEAQEKADKNISQICKDQKELREAI